MESAKEQVSTPEEKSGETQENSGVPQKMEKLFTITEVAFALVFSILVTLFAINYVVFAWKGRFSTIIRWSAAVVFWGWTMVLTLYVVDWLSRRWPKRVHLLLQLTLSLFLGGAVVYYLLLTFRR